MGNNLAKLSKEIDNLYNSVVDRSFEDRVERFKDFFLARFSGKDPERIRNTLTRLKHEYSTKTEEPQVSVTGANVEKLNAIIKTVAGENAPDLDSEDVDEVVERLCSSINTVFESVNEIIGAINKISPLLGEGSGELTVRQVIRERLDKTVDPGGIPLKEHLEKIKLAFQVSLEAFKEAIQEKFREIIEEISPEKLSEDIGGKGMKIGPMYKASLFDAYEEKYKRLYQFMEKGHLLQEVVLVFERKFGNKLIQGERK